MKLITKTKIYFAIIAVVVLSEAILFQQLWSAKIWDYNKPALNIQESNAAKNNTNEVHDGKTEFKSSEPIPKASSKELGFSADERELLSVGAAKTDQKERSVVKGEIPDLGIEDEEIDLAISKAQMIQIWESQDKVMSTWPAYSDVREQLRKELLGKLDPNSLSDEEIIQAARQFCENFWQGGGCLSRTSYRDAYLARILLEYGYERNPQNMEMTDELLETMQTVCPLVKFEKEKNAVVRNEELAKMFLDLRGKQFEQIRNEVADGRKPTLQDFICANDTAFLQQKYDKAAAKQVVEWLRSNANEGGWAEYDDILATFEKYLSQGEELNFNIYVTLNEAYPEDYKYSRRLPSFRGPAKREAILWGLIRQGTTDDGVTVTLSQSEIASL